MVSADAIGLHIKWNADKHGWPAISMKKVLDTN